MIQTKLIQCSDRFTEGTINGVIGNLSSFGGGTFKLLSIINVHRGKEIDANDDRFLIVFESQIGYNDQ